MDVTFGPPPKLRESFGDFLNQATATWEEWIDWGGWVAIAASGHGVLTRGALFSTSFKVRTGLSKLAGFVVPFGVFVERPGVLHLALDALFYKGPQAAKPAFEFIDEQYRLIRDWLDNVDEAGLLSALGPAKYAELTANGTVKDVTVVGVVAPAWLSDP